MLNNDKSNLTIKNADDLKKAHDLSIASEKILDGLLDEFYRLLTETPLPYMEQLLNFDKFEYHLEKDIILKPKTNGKYYKGLGNASPIIVYSFNRDKLKSEIKNIINDDEDLFYFVEFGDILIAGPVLCKRVGDKITPCPLNLKNHYLSPVKYIATDKFRDYYFHLDVIVEGNEIISFENPYSKKFGFLRLLKDNSLDFDEKKVEDVLKGIKGIMDRVLNFYYNI